MIVKTRYTIRESEMRPTSVFSMDCFELDFLAGPDENDHQAEEANGGQDVEDVCHDLDGLDFVG